MAVGGLTKFITFHASTEILSVKSGLMDLLDDHVYLLQTGSKLIDLTTNSTAGTVNRWNL